MIKHLLRPLNFLPDRSTGESLLPWVIGVMLFLTTLSLAMTIALGSGLERWSKGLTNSLSVQVITEDDTVRASETERVLTMLRATPGIASAEVAAESEVIELLSPWLGDIPVGSDLPIPTLIDVVLEAPDSVKIDALRERLKAISPNVAVDDHQAWMNRIVDLATLVRVILIGVMAMVILSTVAIVIFGARTSLATHRDSIEIMHLIGAENDMIAAVFDRRYLIHGIKGGLGGVFIAGGTLYALISMAERMGQGLLTATIPEMSLLWWFLLLPLAAALLTLVTSHITVRRVLDQMV